MQHAHGALRESRSDHLLDLADRGELSALTRLLELDLAGEETPEDLRNELIVRVSLSAEDLLQHVEEMVSI